MKNKIIRNAGTITFLLCVLFYALPFKPKPYGDGEYHRGTLQLIDFIKNGFHGEVEVTKGLFTLLYYLIPYSFLQFFKSQKILWLGALVWNWLCVSWGVQLLFRSLRNLLVSDRILFGLFVLINLFPIHIYYSMGILSESAAFLLSSAFVYYLSELYHREVLPPTVPILLSVSLACFISVRPNFLPFAPLFLIAVPMMPVMLRMKGKIVLSFFMGLGMLVLLEKKMDHSDAEFKKFQLVKGFVWSRYELRNEPFNWLPQHGMDEYASEDYKNNLRKRVEIMQRCKEQHLDMQKEAFHWMMNDIKEHPGLFLHQCMLKYFQSQTFIITPLMKSHKSIWLKWGIHIYINLVNYLLLIGFFFSLWVYFKRKRNPKIFGLLFLFYATAFVTIFFLHSEQRYVFPTRPVLVYMMAYSMHLYFISKSRKLEGSSTI